MPGPLVVDRRRGHPVLASLLLVPVAAHLTAAEIRLWPDGPARWQEASGTLEPTHAAWDLATCGEVQVTLANPGEVPMTVTVRLASDVVTGTGGQGSGAFGKPIGLEPYQRFAEASTTIPPTASASVVIALRPVPFAGDIPPLTGIRTAPPELRNRVDPAHLVALTLRTTGPGQPRLEEVLARGEPLPSDPRPAFLPCIDRFGQYRHRAWPGKIVDEADLAARAAAETVDQEAHPAPADWNDWGGWVGGPTLAATGAFRVETRPGGGFWLVDPTGARFWSQGVCSVGSELVCRQDGTWASPHTIIDGRESWFEGRLFDDPAQAGFVGSVVRVHAGLHAGKTVRTFAFPALNLARKLGPDWAEEDVRRLPGRLRSWGFNTYGNWSQPSYAKPGRLPYTVGLSLSKARTIAGATGHWGSFPDPWGDLPERIAEALEARPEALTDPANLGYFIGNELTWGGPTHLACAALNAPADQPARRALTDWLRQRHGTIAALNAAWGTAFASWEDLVPPTDRTLAMEDLTACNALLCETFFARSVEVIRRRAPGRLVLGCRFVVGWPMAQALEACARHADVVSLNVYARTWAEVRLPDVAAPLLISEYGIGARDRGLSTGHLFEVPDQAARAAWIRDWQAGAAADRRIVGCHWFQYRDESVAGRAHDGEDFQCGLVDVTDTPYPETVAAFREVGRRLYGALPP